MKKNLVTIFSCIIAASQSFAADVVKDITIQEPTVNVREMADISVRQPSIDAVTTYDINGLNAEKYANGFQNFNLFFSPRAKGQKANGTPIIWIPNSGSNSPISSFLGHFNDIFIHTNNVTMASNPTVSASAIHADNAVPSTTLSATNLGSTNKSSRPTVDPIGHMPMGDGLLPLILLVLLYAILFVWRNKILNKDKPKE